MADRELPELRSRLRVDTSDLARAGRDVEGFQAKVGKPIKPSLDASGLQKFSSLLERNAQDLQRFGRTATRDLTLPLVAAGAASTKLSLDFDNTFQRMVSLAGVSADEVDGLKESVKKLSTETGKGPQDLAEGLETIRSAGIDGAAAMDVLESSAKAASIGLGSTREVADAVTSVLGSYGQNNITAARATDILAGSVQAAKVQASELAPQFGRILPLASTLGVSFEQVGGSLAFLTRGSGDASLAAAQLGGILQKLLNPGAQARTILEGVGLTVQQLQDNLRNKGLINTLDLLNEKLGGNKQQLARFFEDAQGIQGALALLGQDNGAGAAEVIGEVGDSVGKVNDAFAGFSETDSAKLKKAFAEVQVEMINLGGALAPLVSKIAGGVAGIAKAFGGLPEPIQTGLLAIGGIIAIVGPLSSAVGKIGANISQLRDIASRGAGAFRSLGAEGSAGAGTLVSSMGPAIAAVGLLAIQVRKAVTSAKELRSEAEATGDSLENVLGKKLAEFASKGQAVDFLKRGKADVNDLLTIVKGGTAGFEAQQRLLQNILKSFGETNTGQVDGLESFLGSLGDVKTEFATASGDQKRYEANLKDLGIATDEDKAKTDAAAGATADFGNIIDSTGGDVKDATDTLLEHINALLGFESANRSAADAVTAYNDNQKTAAGEGKEIEQIRSDAAKQLRDDERNRLQLQKAAQQASRDVNAARRSEAEAAKDVERAVKDEADAIKHEGDLKKKATDLQRGLTAALAEGEKQLLSLKRTAEGDQLSVKDAERAVQAARDAVNGFGSNGPTQDDPNTSVNERQAALDDLRRAELALADAKDTAAQSAADQADADKKGVAGTPAVTDALQAIHDNDVALATAHQDVIDKAGAVEVANQRLADSHQGVTDALDKEAEANRAIGDAAEESRQKQKDALDKIATLTDEAKKKSDELKIAAETAVGAFITAAKNAGIPIDAITAGVKNLLEKALPDLKTGIETLFKDLVNPAFAPPGSEADQGLYSLGGGRSSKAPKQSIDKPGVTVPESTVPASAGLPQTYDSLPEGFYWFYDVEAQGWYGAKVPNRNADVALADITSRPPTGEKLPDGYYWYFDSKAGTWYSAKIPEKTTDVPLAEGAPVKKPASVLPASQLNLVYPQDGFYRPNGDIISPAEYVATVAAARKRKAEERLNNVADQPAPPSVIGGFTNTGNQRPSVRPVARGSKDLTGATPTELAEAIVKAGKAADTKPSVVFDKGAFEGLVQVVGEPSAAGLQQMEKVAKRVASSVVDDVMERVAS